MAEAELPPQEHQNYHHEFEAAINHQINLELYSSYVYLSMGYYFNRHDVALNNFKAFFMRKSEERRKRAKILLQLQNDRGGNILLFDIKKPELDDWGSGQQAVEYAFQMEQALNQNLRQLYQLAIEKHDVHLSDFLESHVLPDQVDAIGELGNHINNLNNLSTQGKSLASYFFSMLYLEDSEED